MKTTRKMKYFRTGLVLLASLLLWNPLQAGAFAQNGGGGGMGRGGAADGPSLQGVSGTVVETMNSGGYSYALVEKDGIKTWVALPASQITVGSQITCLPGMTMHNFNSTSLNRTFESIVFSPGLASASGAAAGAPKAAAAGGPVQVDKAEGPNAYTIGEIFEKKDSLANTPVTIKAKVVKVSRGILGKTWLHLQDGTGSQTSGTNDLVVTTDSTAEIGEVVTITGNLSLDRNFGSGYQYNVIVEEAQVNSGK
jgi:hypothetical protein